MPAKKDGHQRPGCIPWEVLSHPLLSATDKVVYAALERYGFKSGKCYPSQTTLARDICKGRLTVLRSLKRLEELDLIQAEFQRGSVSFYKLKAGKFAYGPVSDTTQVETDEPVSDTTQVADEPVSDMNNDLYQNRQETCIETDTQKLLSNNLLKEKLPPSGEESQEQQKDQEEEGPGFKGKKPKIVFPDLRPPTLEEKELMAYAKFEAPSPLLCEFVGPDTKKAWGVKKCCEDGIENHLQETEQKRNGQSTPFLGQEQDTLAAVG